MARSLEVNTSQDSGTAEPRIHYFPSVGRTIMAGVLAVGGFGFGIQGFSEAVNGNYADSISYELGGIFLDGVAAVNLIDRQKKNAKAELNEAYGNGSKRLEVIIEGLSAATSNNDGIDLTEREQILVNKPDR